MTPEGYKEVRLRVRAAVVLSMIFGCIAVGVGVWLNEWWVWLLVAIALIYLSDGMREVILTRLAEAVVTDEAAALKAQHEAQLQRDLLPEAQRRPVDVSKLN